MNKKLNGTDFASLFGPDEIICGTGAAARDDVLTELLRLLADRKGIGDIVDYAYKALIARENLTSTIIAPGIAIPHARLEGIDNLLVSVATSRSGIRFAEGSAGIVHLVILMLVPKDAPGVYLQAVSSLAKILNDASAAEKAAELSSADDVWRFFSRGGLQLPDYVCAGDIMTRNPITVLETDSLEHAIDMFVEHRMDELPVTDKDGNLVGIVTEDELLRVCLPDHIMWMEDLSPIINFEPFTAVLRNESRTWLADIMSFDYATVREDSPAIEVARKLREHPSHNVLVTRDKKLMGIVSLQDFINKVLRD